MTVFRFVLLCFMGMISFASAQVITPFTIRHQVTQKGGIRYVSNTSVSCNGGAACNTARAENPPAGTGYDNNFTAAYVDIDTDPTTFSSSSDSLDLPACSEISWAGLYWGGEMTNAGAQYAVRNQCRIKVNNGAYVNLTADAMQDNAVGFTTYHCFKDITSIVQAAGLKSRFTVANTAARVGGTNRFGGWTIVVVYKNDLQPMRNLTVFNGLSNVSTANLNTDVTVSGFLTPLAGPVTFEIGHVTYDGDRSLVGDQLMFNGAGTFINISDAANNPTDVFNSTLAYNGVAKVAPFINPAYRNTLGYDADIFIPNNAAKNYIGNSATSATLRLTTQNPGGETYLTQVVSMAIDVYEPDLRAAVRVQDLNGGLVEPGDILEYTVVGKNIGSDPSVNTFITDTIEYNATYVPGSLRVTAGPNVGPKTDAPGDDQGEYDAAQRVVRVRIGTGANGTTGGQVLNSPTGIDSTEFVFQVQASSDCINLSCDNVIDNRAIIQGSGNVSGNFFSNGSNPGIFDAFGCPIPGTTSSPVNTTTCFIPNDTTIAFFCDEYNFSALPYTGYTYYNSAFSTVTDASGPGVYYAVYGAYPSCNDTVVITITATGQCFNVPPVVDNETHTINEDNSATGDLTDAGDFDPDGTPLTANTVPVSGPTNGSIIINPNGTYTYTPNPNYNGTDMVVVQICDAGTPMPAACVNDTIFITINPVNDPPVLDDEVHVIAEDNPATGDLTDAGDSDPEGTPLTANTVPLSGPTNGSIVINPNGTYTYTPDPGYNGPDQVVVQVCDAGIPMPAACANDTIFITVTPVNDPPVLDNETHTINEDNPATGDLTDAGDTDPDGTPLTANTVPVSGPTNGSIVINPNGTYTYTPDPNFNGTDQVVVEICDAGTPLPAACAFDTIFITVNPVNDPPIVDNETHTINEDNPATGDLTDGGDTDPDGTPLTATTIPVSGPANGTIVINPNGTYTYTPDPNFNGTDQVVVEICDAGIPMPAACVFDTIFITVNPVNDPPILDNETHVINEDNPATGDLTDGGDSDPEGTPLTANTVPVSGPANGTIVINPNGTYTYTPDPNFNGTDQVVVEICDAGLPLPAACAFDTIFITVNPVNDPPVVDNETHTINEDNPATGDLTDGGDTDPDGTPLTATTIPVSGPANGTIVINPNGTYTYTPDPNFNGTDQVVVEICDAGTPMPAACVFDTIFITVNPVNDPPILDNETHVITENTSATGDLTDAGDTDPDGTTLTANTVPVSGPANGTIVINPNGTYTYTPNTGYNGTDQVVVQICDAGTPLPPSCLNDTIFITVNPFNDPPVVDNETHTTNEDTPVSGDLTDAGDLDPDGTPLTATTVPVSGPSNGSIVINPNGTYTYTPGLNFNGLDTVVVQICDAGIPLPAACVNDTIFITVIPVNDPPVVDNENHTINEDTPVSADLTDGGDTDPDGTPLTATTIPVSGPANGTIVINPNGTYTYTPDPNFNGTDQVVVQICDAGTPLPPACVNDTIFITVVPVNDPPVANPDTAIIPEDTASVTICVTANDTDIDGDPLTVTTNCGPSNGTASVVANCIVYTPNLNFFGNDTICYYACDPSGACDTTIVTITVTPLNDPPVVTPDTVIIPEDTSVVTICVTGNDTDVEGDPLTVTTNCGPSNGTATVVANCIVYTPDPNFFGNDTICYIACDPSGDCDTTIVTITVTPVNDPPVANPDTVIIPEDTANVTICVTGNDTDIEGDPLTVTTNCGPSNGTASVVANCIVYTPNPNFNGNDTICYYICDPSGDCDTTIVTITVTPVNDPPVVNPDTVIIPEDTASVTICVTNNDTDVEGDPLTMTTNCGPSNGTATVVANCIVYTPNPNFSGNDTICYIACDPNGGCDTTIVTITVTPVNDPPVANPDTVIIPEDTASVTICVTGNDTDIEGDPLTVTTNCGPSNGTASVVANCIVYTPNPNFFGNDTICYIACDPNGGCDTTIVTITVTPVNDPPVVNPDTIVIPEDTASVTICVTNNDTDVEGDPLTMTTNCGPSNGTATVVANCIVYTPNPNFSGNDTICYIACDPNGGCDTTIVTITVTPVNDPPVANPDTVIIPEDTASVTICVTGNDTDVEGDPLTVTTNCGPSNGTASVVANCIVYTPNPNFFGNDTICYIACDPNGGCDTTIVTITVTPVNDPPVVNPDTVTIPEDTASVTICVTGNDTDLDGDSLTVTVSCLPSNGTATLAGNCITYTPDPNFNGNDTICYIACDPNGGCDTTIVTITVTPVNDPPVANPDTVIIPEDTANVTICVTGNDTDAEGDSLSVTISCTPDNGTAVMTGNCITYTPDPNFNGTDTICYIACDPSGACDTTIVVINVTPVNDPPVAVDDSITIPTGGSGVIHVQSNDTDVDGDPLTTTIYVIPGHGTATVINGDSILYTPDPGFVGLDTLLYIVCDGGVPPLCDTAIVVINVINTAINNPPLANDDSTSTPMGTVVFISVLGNDSDPDGDSLSVPTIIANPVNGVAVVIGDSIVYIPNSGFMGYDSLTYVICDDGIPPMCDTATVVIYVYPTNNPPVAVNDSVTVQGGNTGVIPVLINDFDPDSTYLTVTLCDQPEHGTAVINANGTISYTPDPDYEGMDTLCYIICDQGTPTLCDTAYVFITVEPNVGLIIPNLFTPNGDGDNEVFEILGLDKYPNATLDVFNRWGNLVYNGDPYQNQWNGYSNRGLPLPVGTYYYVLDLKDGSKGLSGFVVIHR